MLTSCFVRSVRALAPAALLTLLPSGVLADGGVDIAKVAPARSFLVLSVPDFSQFRSAFEKSELGALWREPSVVSFVEEVTKDQSKQFGEFLKEVGIRTEDLKPPTGQVGLAMFLPERDAAANGGDEKKPDSSQPELLIVADMGDNADGLQDSLERLIDRGVKDKKITTEEDTYAGAKITTIKPVHDENKDNGESDDDSGDEGASGVQGFLAGPLTKNKDIEIARSGSEFMLCTNRKVIEAALEAAGGRAGDVIGDAQVYRDSLDQHPANALATAVLVLNPLLDAVRGWMAEGFAQGEDVQAGDKDAAAAVLDASGASSLKSVSMALRLDTPDGMMETTIGVLAPEKKGFLSLFTERLGPFDPPGFVPPDAASVTRYSVKLSGVYDVLRSIASAMPEERAKMFNSYLDQGANLVKPLLDAAGPSIYMVETYKQPFAADSAQTTVAIQSRDQTAISNVLVAFAPQMGLESREFEGNTIYSGKGFPIAIGLGFEKVFIGTPASVENSMRLAGRTDAPKISAERGFQEATRSLNEDSVAASFMDIRQTVRWTYWQFQNELKLMEDRINAMDQPEDQKAEIIKRIREHQPEWIDHLPPLETVLSHLGDSASEMHPTADGFRGRSIMLRPSADAGK